jgi:hypothetical protein
LAIDKNNNQLRSQSEYGIERTYSTDQQGDISKISIEVFHADVLEPRVVGISKVRRDIRTDGVGEYSGQVGHKSVAGLRGIWVGRLDLAESKGAISGIVVDACEGLLVYGGGSSVDQGGGSACGGPWTVFQSS